MVWHSGGTVLASICLLGLVIIPKALSMDPAAFAGNTSQSSGTHVEKEENTTASGIAESADEDYSETSGQGHEEAADLAREQQNQPCEAGHPCGADMWCSPTRQVCRPCSDVLPWCNHTDTIHNRYPTCERYCYEKLRYVAETCEVQKEMNQRKLEEKESVIKNLTAKIARAEVERNKTKTQLEKYRKTPDSKDDIIAVLAVALTVFVGSTVILSAYLYYLVHLKPKGPRATQDPENIESAVQSDDSGMALLEEVKTPVQANTNDSGQLHCGAYAPGNPRVTGDSTVVVS